jgi:hypothetical protein
LPVTASLEIFSPKDTTANDDNKVSGNNGEGDIYGQPVWTQPNRKNHDDNPGDE